MAVRATRNVGPRREIFWLLGLNALFFIVSRVAALITTTAIGWFELGELPGNFSALLAQPWSIITYMFIQYEFSHLAVNMLWLYLFGALLAERARMARLWLVYLAGGIIGGISFIMVNHNVASTLCGSSAAVLSIVAATTLIIPRERVRLALFGNVAIWKIAFLVLIVMVIGVSTRNIGGFAAHLGGTVSGIVLGIYLRRHRKSVKPMEQPKTNKPSEELLTKLRRSGYNSLTSEERKQLLDSSKQP